MKKKVMAVAVMTTTLLAGFGTMAAQAHRVPACWLSENAAEHNPHCQRGHDTDPPGGGEHGDCDTISIDLGIEIDICLLVEVDADDLLEVLGLLDGFSVHDKLEWLHGHMSLGDKIDWLLEVIDLDFVWDHFGWFEPGDVFGLLHFIGGGVHDHALGLLDLDLVDGIFDGDGNGGGGGGGGDDCSGLVNVCGNANNLNVEDVLDVCTVNADNGFGNGPGDDGNADCDVVDLGEGLLGLGDMDSDWVGFLF